MTLQFKNAAYADAENKFINMEIRLDAEVNPNWVDMNGQWVPFTATADDVMVYGRELFQAAVASGNVTPFQAPSSEELRAVMRSLTPREFRDALIDADIMPDQVTAAIEQMPDPKARAKALNAWEYPTQFVRTDPLVGQIGSIFGLTPEAIDALWIEASAA